MPNTKGSTASSKTRVRDHGEVFTSEREVQAMLDLVKQETQRIDSRFLEPACGTGNFLIEVLTRKLAIVEKRYKKSQLEYERNALVALSSMYGVDILQDNVQRCKDRLLDMFIYSYQLNFKKKVKPEYIQSATFILDRNILWGDALTLKTPDQKAEPIVFSEWSRPFNDSRIKRRDFYFHELSKKEDLNLFTSLTTSDMGTSGFIPQSFKNFPLVHFLKIGQQ